MKKKKKKKKRKLICLLSRKSRIEYRKTSRSVVCTSRDCDVLKIKELTFGNKVLSMNVTIYWTLQTNSN